ncbi:MAG: phthalate 4,5-cis-dihydrodiol dehydrogenase, partial [Alphaproteobacteria bacterium]
MAKGQAPQLKRGAKLRVGIAGLGVASTQVLPAFHAKAPYELAGGADNRPDARKAFSAEYDRPAYKSVEELCRRDDVDAVWVSTPNPLHMEHTVLAARHGKHVICEKPMALDMRQCDRMIRACADAGVRFVQGHSKIYQPPIRAIRDVVKSGKLGRVVQIQATNFNDWLQRPRLAPEVDTTKGGGIVYRQGPHLVDIVRFIGGGMVKSVRGVAGRADKHFKTEGHFSALLEFENGTAATLTLNGYGYFDVTELTWGIGESGYVQTGGRVFPRADRPRIKGPADPKRKSAGAEERGGHKGRDKEKKHQPFFGLTVVACEKGVVRQSPDGLFIYTEKGRKEVPCTNTLGREAELGELTAALRAGRSVFPDGNWGKATLEVCLAIL